MRTATNVGLAWVDFGHNRLKIREYVLALMAQGMFKALSVDELQHSVRFAAIVAVLATASSETPAEYTIAVTHETLVTKPTVCRMLSAMANDKKRGKKPAPPADQIVPNDPASISFVRGLMARGEASRPDAQGRLPPGATHEIVGETAEGLPIVVRRRFSTH